MTVRINEIPRDIPGHSKILFYPECHSHGQDPLRIRQYPYYTLDGANKAAVNHDQSQHNGEGDVIIRHEITNAGIRFDDRRVTRRTEQDISAELRARLGDSEFENDQDNWLRGGPDE